MRMYSVVAWCTFFRRVPSDFGALLTIRAMLLFNCDVYCESHFLRPNMHLLQYPAQSRATTSYFAAFETLFKSILDMYSEVLWHLIYSKLAFLVRFVLLATNINHIFIHVVEISLDSLQAFSMHLHQFILFLLMHHDDDNIDAAVASDHTDFIYSKLKYSISMGIKAFSQFTIQF